jgi:rubrerythrin
MEITLEKAIANAAASEEQAARFYRLLAENNEDPEAKAFFEEMENAELEHARSIREHGRMLGLASTQLRPDSQVEMVETAPGWRDAEGLSYPQALEVALEAENHAALYYDALADFVSGEIKQFFQSLARTEEQHAERILALKQKRS